jgi:hypothetical protein
MTTDESPMVIAKICSEGIVSDEFSTEDPRFERPRPISEESAVAGTLA